MLLACLLTTFAVPLQDPPPAQTPAERVDALIAKTNAYEHFVATYKVRDKQGEESEMRFCFRAPDHGLLDMRSAKSSMQQFFEGQTIVIRGHSDAGPDTVATIHSLGVQQQLAESAMTALDEVFPRKSAASAPEGRNGLNWRISVGADCEGLNISLGTGSGELLGWLQDMRRQPEQLSAAGATELVFRPCEKARLVLSAETGFVSKLEKLLPQGPELRMQLVSLDLEAPASDAFFTPPPPAAGAKDESESYEAMTLAVMFVQVRGDLFRRIGRRIDERQIEWNDESRAKLCKLVRRVDGELLTAANGQVIARLERNVDALAQALQEKLASAGPELRAELKAGAGRDRAGLEKHLQQVAEKVLAQKPSGLGCKLRPSLDEDLLALEEPILREIYAESVTKPLLARYDEKVGKQFEAK